MNNLLKRAVTIAAFVACICCVSQIHALDNGLAKTPPMGWNSWNIFHENINENQIKEIADAMVSTGMKDAGYVYLNLDDNWMATSRDEHGRLRADPVRFPSGMKALGDYIHSKGLKFGIYGDRGLRTCHHYHMGPEGSGSGSYRKEQLDAETFASWGVDYLKYDNCDPAPGSNMQEDYENMRDALAQCGRDIVFSICAWGFQRWMPDAGNLWRSTGDISDAWETGDGFFMGIIEIIDRNANLAQYAKPGAWNDPDMLQIGNGGCTTEEYRTHMTMWCIMAAPLIAGNDIRNMSKETSDILLNREAIAVNQDSAGIQGTRINAQNGLEVWCKPLGSRNGTTKAVALLNRNDYEAEITVHFADIGLSGEVYVRDLWAKTDRGVFSNSYTMSVPPHGTGMLKLSGAPPEPRTAFSWIEAESYNEQSGVETESCSEGGENIGFIQDGDFALYRSIDFGEGANGFQAIVASNNSRGGTIEIRLDNSTGDLLGSCAVPSSGGWQTWTTVNCGIDEVTGEHDICLVFTGENDYLLNVDKFQFALATGHTSQIEAMPRHHHFRTDVSNGSISVTPFDSRCSFSVKVIRPDGRTVASRNNVTGQLRIPISGRGIYLVNIEVNTHIEKKQIYMY